MQPGLGGMGRDRSTQNENGLKPVVGRSLYGLTKAGALLVRPGDRRPAEPSAQEATCLLHIQ